MSSPSDEVRPAMFAEEFAKTEQEGASLMQAMVRQSIFSEGALPPQEFVSWYVMYSVYRYTLLEHRVRNKLGDTDVGEVEEARAELEAIVQILAKTKQFVLAQRVKDTLDQHTMSITLGG